MVRCNFKIFIVSLFLVFLVSFTPSLIADQKVSNQPSINKSIPQSTIQNLSSTSIGKPKFEKSELIQKTKKLQIPFVANEGQTDEKVAFYANTFGGTVFVTKNGEIVYALPNNSSELGVRSLESEGKRQGTCRGVVSTPVHDSEASIQECRGEWHSPNAISPLKRGAGGVSERSQKGSKGDPNALLMLSPEPNISQSVIYQHCIHTAKVIAYALQN